MFGVIYFSVFIVLGFFISNLGFKDQPIYIRIWVGSLIGLLGMMWLVVPFSFLLKFSVTSHLLALSLMLIIYFVMKNFSKNDNTTKINNDGCEKVLLSVVVPIFLLIAYLLYTHVIYEGENGALFGGQSTYGDLSLHLGIITSIATQATFPPQYSIFPGKFLSYPFLVDSLSSSMYLLGTSLRWSILIPSFVMVLMMITGFFILAKEITKNKYASAIGTILFFFNGGFGFIYFMDGIRKSPSNFTRMFTEYYKTPTNYNEHFIRWSNTICDMIIPQRTTMAGWTMALLAFWLIYKALTERKRLYFLYSGIVVGLLPMIHTHSFLAVGIISACWCIIFMFDIKENNKFITSILKVNSLVLLTVSIIYPKAGWLAIMLLVILMIYSIIKFIYSIEKRVLLNYVASWIYFLIPVAILALPQLLFWTFPQSSSGNFIKPQQGWAANEGDIWPWFWIKNIGVVMLLLIPSILAAERKLQNIILGPLVLFTISNLIIFQPNVYDNNKLLYIWYVFAVIIVANYIISIYKLIKGMAGRWSLILGIIFIGTFSGLLTIGREINSSGIQNYSSAEVEAAEYIKNNTSKDAVFITGNQHLNPAAALAGRNIYSGTPLYLYFHGIDYSKRESEIKKIYENPREYKSLLDKINIDYIYVSNYEKTNYKVDLSFFLNNYSKVFQKEDITIFAVP